MNPNNFEAERTRRAEQLAKLFSIDPSLKKIPAKALRELDVFRGGRGTYAPYVRSSGTDRRRVVKSVLNTGKHYADELSAESLVYRFPLTKLPGYDRSDVQAGKDAMRFRLPVFVILSPPKKSPLREVRIGYIVDVDDGSQQFLIRFQVTAETPLPQTTLPDDSVFAVTIQQAKRKRRMSAIRGNDQAQFSFKVGKRYGSKCGFCDIAVGHLLDAAHIVAVADNGSDDPRNGLRLCKNHHAAFDAGLVSIGVDGCSICTINGLTTAALGITEQVVTTATGALPHLSAIEWRNELANRTSSSGAITDA